MHISELFIRRPVFATVVALILILVGLVSYERLTVREYPAIDEPVVTVTTAYRGASASVIEREVTQPLEEAMAGIEGIEILTSSSRPESSQVTARFTLSTDPDVAASDVRDRVGRARGQLPDDVDEPIIAKVEADAKKLADAYSRKKGKNGNATGGSASSARAQLMIESSAGILATVERGSPPSPCSLARSLPHSLILPVLV